MFKTNYEGKYHAFITMFGVFLRKTGYYYYY